MKLKDYITMLDKIELSPAYQRGEVWSRAHRREFLDHVARFRKVPTIMLRKLADDTYEMLDGKQRSECLREHYAKIEEKERKAFEDVEVQLDIRERLTDDQAVQVFQDLQGGTRLTSAEVLFSSPSRARDAAYELAALPFFEKVTFRSVRKDIQDLCLKLLYAEHVKADNMPKDGTASNLAEFCRKFEKMPLPTSEMSRVRDTLVSMNKETCDIAALNKTDVVNLYLVLQTGGDKLNGWFRENRERLRKELVAHRISAVHAKFKERREYIAKEVKAASLSQEECSH